MDKPFVFLGLALALLLLLVLVAFVAFVLLSAGVPERAVYVVNGIIGAAFGWNIGRWLVDNLDF